MPLVSDMVCGHPMYLKAHGRCTCPKCDHLSYASDAGYAGHMQRLGEEIGAKLGIPRRVLGHDMGSPTHSHSP